MELKLDRKLADKRVFPAVDLDASSTRKEELLVGPEELSRIWKLRRALHAAGQHDAIEQVKRQLRQTTSNADFLRSVVSALPSRS
jgi:transcription termination factor Rho